MAEPRAAAPRWTDWGGVMLAQSSLDQRSPFGANAVDNNNKVTPAAATTAPLPRPTSDNPDVPGSTAPPTRSSTQVPPVPPPGQPDAAPPLTGTGTTTTAPPTAAPGTAKPTSTPGGAAGTGNASGTTSAPDNPIAPIAPIAPSPAPGNINQRSSSTLPGRDSAGRKLGRQQQSLTRRK